MRACVRARVRARWRWRRPPCSTGGRCGGAAQAVGGGGVLKRKRVRSVRSGPAPCRASGKGGGEKGRPSSAAATPPPSSALSSTAAPPLPLLLLLLLALLELVVECAHDDLLLLLARQLGEVHRVAAHADLGARKEGGTVGKRRLLGGTQSARTASMRGGRGRAWTGLGAHAHREVGVLLGVLHCVLQHLARQHLVREMGKGAK